MSNPDLVSDWSAMAMASIVSCATVANGAGSTGGAGTAPSDQETSAGRTSVEVPRGADNDAATPSAASPATAALVGLDRTHFDTFDASASMSDCSGASYLAWVVA